MTQYKKYLLVSIAAVSLIPHMAQAATTAAAAGAGSSDKETVAKGPLAPLTMADLVRFKPASASTDATEVVVAGGMIWGPPVTAATLKPLEALRGTWSTETPSIVNAGASLANNVEVMHGLIDPLLKHFAAVFTATAEINAPKAKPAGGSVKPSDVRAAAKSAVVASAPEAFPLADYLKFIVGSKDAEQTVGGKDVATVKPLQDLFAGWAKTEALFNPAASAKDNMVALHDAVRTLIENDAQGFSAYTTAVAAAKRAAAMAEKPSVLKSHEIPADDLAKLRQGAEADKPAASAAGATVVSLEKARAAEQEKATAERATAAKKLEDLKATHTAALRAAETGITAHMDAKMAELQASHAASLTELHASHAAAVAALEAKLLEAAGVKSALEADKAALRAAVATHEGEIMVAQARALSAEEEVRRRAASLASVAAQQAENVSIRAAMAAATARAEAADATVTALKTANTGLMSKMAEKSSVVDGLSARLGEVVKEKDTKIGDLLTENLRFQDNASTLEGEKLSLDARVAELEAQIVRMKAGGAK